MLGNHSSECGITMNGNQATSSSTVNDLQCSMSRWYFTRQEIEDLSPSRKDGINYKKETELRMLYCSFLQDLGIKLKVPQVTIASAMLLCHRFYLRQSHAKNEWQTMATVSMFLACKVEETPRLLTDVIVVAYEIMYRKNPTAAQRIKQKDIYEKQKELVLLGERILLATIGFDFNIPLPYKPLVAALKRMKISHNDIAKVAWNFLNDWLRTTLCLQYKPHYLAAGSMYLAAKFNKVKLPSEKGNVWWLEFDVMPQKLEEVIQQMLGLLEENKRPAVPSQEKNTRATVTANKELPKSTQSCGASMSVITSNSKDEICREGGVGSTSTVPKKDDHHESHRFPCKDIPDVKEQVLQCQTSDSGSSHSVVEDGEDRTNEGEVQGTVIKSEHIPDSSRDSSHEGEARATVIQSIQVVSVKVVSCSGGLSKVDKDRIREAIKKRKLENGADRTNEGKFQGTMIKSEQILDSSRDGSCVGDAQPAEIQSDQVASTKDVPGSGGLSKIDKDRIREAIKKRKSASISNKKVVKKSTDNELDDDSWIVRELENGLEMDAAAEKRQRLVA